MTKVEKIQDLLQDIEEDTRRALLKEIIDDLKHDMPEAHDTDWPGWDAAIAYLELNYGS